jgi:hypothetical protein
MRAKRSWIRLCHPLALVMLTVSCCLSMTGTTVAVTARSLALPVPGRPLVWVSPSQYESLISERIATPASGYIFCTVDPQEPFVVGSLGNLVEANGIAECTATPDVWNDRTVVWGYDGRKDEATGGGVSSTPPTKPDGRGGVIKNYHDIGGVCRHGWRYHYQISASAFHGNWSDYSKNSGPITLC